jgi:hypothetical protein
MPHPQPDQNPQSEPASEPQPPTRRCRHIFAAGRQCGSPCLRTEQFCYFHHTTRRPVSDPKTRRARTTTYDLPVPEDRDSIRAAVAQVMHDVANNHIDPRRAGLILYSLQIALCALPKEQPVPTVQPHIAASISAAARPASRRHNHRNSQPVNHIIAEPIVEEAVLDDQFGLIAPETFLAPETPEEDEDDDPDYCGDEIRDDGRRQRDTLIFRMLREVELFEARTQGWNRGRRNAFEEAAKSATAAAAHGATATEIAKTLTQSAAAAAATEDASNAELVEHMRKSPTYTGLDADDPRANDIPSHRIDDWEFPVLPSVDASADPPARVPHRSPLRHGTRDTSTNAPRPRSGTAVCPPPRGTARHNPSHTRSQTGLGY